MSTALTPWRVKKLPDDSFAYLVPDAEIRTDGGKMCVKVIVSTETMDRERDIMLVKGADLRNHQRNPAVLFNHKKDWPLVARAEDPAGNYTVKAVGDRLESTNYFIQGSKLANQIFRLVENGSLRGISPGFMTRPGGVQKTKANDGHPAFVYTDWELIEITHCPIGMNGENMVLSIEKGFGGEAMLPELKEALLPFLPERNAKVTGGWETKSYDPPAADDTDIDLSDAEAVPLTPSSQYYHAVYQKAFDLFAFARELNGTLEAERTKADGRRIEALVGGVLDACLKGHAGHVNEYPEQPGLPGNPNEDVAREVMSEWRVKAMEAWDDYRRERAVDNPADIVDAIKFLSALASDRQMPTKVRAVAKQFVGRLSNVKLVRAPVDEDETEWGAVAAKLDAIKVGV